MDYVSSTAIGGSNSWSNGCAGGRPCKIVLIVWLTQDSGDTNLYNNVPNTPKYVFSTSYANSVGPGCSPNCPPQDVVVCKQRQGTNGGSGGGWGGVAPITDSWAGTCKDDFGLWNANGAHILYASPGCMSTFGITSNFSGYPVMYENPILTAAEAFISALALHYSNACPNNFSDSCGSGPTIGASIAYMRIGPSSGGENYPYCACESSTSGSQCDTFYWPGPNGFAAQPGAYTDQGYLTAWTPGSNDGYVASLYQYVHSQHWAFPIDTPAHSGPASFQNITYSDTEALLASQEGFGIGMQAASIGDLVTYAAQPPGLPSTTANWAAQFREFPYVSDHHLQTENPGNPVQAAQFTITGVSSSGGASATITCSSANGDCINLCPGAWVYISGIPDPAFNGIQQVAIGSCASNTIALTGSFPSASYSGSSIGFVYSGAHLPALLPFETQQCQGSSRTICSAELWDETLDWAYGTVTVSNTTGNTGLGDTSYQNAISNFLLGLPSATSSHSRISTTANQH